MQYIKIKRPPTFNQKKALFLHQHLNIGRFHKKKQHFEEKAEEIEFLSNTTSGSYSVLLCTMMQLITSISIPLKVISLSL